MKSYINPKINRGFDQYKEALFGDKEDIGLAYVTEKYDIRGVLVMII